MGDGAVGAGIGSRPVIVVTARWKGMVAPASAVIEVALLRSVYTQ